MAHNEDNREGAHRARGVEILTGLVKKYGYAKPSRLFTIGHARRRIRCIEG